MADSVVTLGLDLSAFDAVLREGMDGLSKGAQRALAGAKKAAAEATREAASALKVQLRLQDQAARDAAAAAREQAAAERQLAAEAQKRADIQARAAKSLAAMAAGRTETERLTHAYREQIAEIQRLVEVTGDQAAGAKAVAAATAQHQAAMAALKPAADDAAGAVKGAAGASWQMQQQVQSLRKNVLDLGQSLIAGQDPLTVLGQQGPQIAEALGQSGDAAEALKNAFGGLTSVAAGLAAPLAGIAIAAASLATAYILVANNVEKANDGLVTLRAQVDASRAAHDKATAAASAQATALVSLSAATRTAQQDLAVLVGTADSYAVALERETKAIRERQRAELLSVTQGLAAAEVALQNEKALLRSRDASVTERAEASQRIKTLERDIVARRAQAAAARAAADAEVQAAADAAEYRRELEASEAVLERRKEAQDRATAASERAAAAEREAAQRARELAETQAAAAKAAREWSMFEGTINATAQELSQLIPEFEAVIALLEQTAAAAQAQAFADLEASVAAFGDEVRSMVTDPLRKAYDSVKALGGTLQEAVGIDLSAFTSIEGAASELIRISTEAAKGQIDAQQAVTDARLAGAAAVKAAEQDLARAVATGDDGAIASARQALASAEASAKEGIAAAKADLEAASPAAFIKGLMDGAVQMVDAIVAALPAVVGGLADGAPKLIDGIISAIPQLVIAIAKAAPQIAIDLATALAVELPIQMLANFPAFAKSLAVGIGEGFVEAGQRIKRVIGDIFREIATGGRADTRTFGDTPGPQRVGPGGARVSAGDYVVAARSREGLAAQMGGQPAPQAVVVTLDVRDGPVSLGLSRAVARDLSRRGAGRDSSGRRSPYGGGGW